MQKHFGNKMQKLRGVWCMGVGCPWCFLEAEHGDYVAAQRQYAAFMARNDFLDRPHLNCAAWHAISDVVEQAHRNGVYPPLVRVDPPHSAQHVLALPGTAPPRFATSQEPSSSSHCRQPTASASSGGEVEPVRIPGDNLFATTRVRTQPWLSTGEQYSLPIPPNRARFEAYGGKKTGWCAYDDASQEILREAYTRKDIAIVRVDSTYGTRSYAVNTDPAHLTQVREDLRADQHGNVRRVRIVDLWNQLDAVYGG